MVGDGEGEVRRETPIPTQCNAIGDIPQRWCFFMVEHALDEALVHGALCPLLVVVSASRSLPVQTEAM